MTPLVNLKGEYNSTPYLIIISIAALALMMLQIVNYFVFKAQNNSRYFVAFLYK